MQIVVWKVVGVLGLLYGLAVGVAAAVFPHRWHHSRWGFKGGPGAEFLETRIGEWTCRFLGGVCALASGMMLFSFLTEQVCGETLAGSPLSYISPLFAGAIIAMFLVLGIVGLWDPARLVRLSHPDFKLGRKELIQYRLLSVVFLLVGCFIAWNVARELGWIG